MSATLEQLRAAFDRDFREPYPEETKERLGLILLRIGDVSYALPLSTISAIHGVTRTGQVPARGARGLVGLATVRNTIVPVFDLAVALGARTVAKPGKWLVIASGEVPIGWSFDTLEGQVLVDPPEGGLSGTTTDISVAGTSRRVIDLEELRNVA